MNQPLSDLRVLDLSQVMAGPFACMLLGDMGADVIKVEPPGTGDQTRSAMEYRYKGTDSPGFLALNRNKRSVEIDLKNEAGRAVFYELVKSADILIENSRPGVMARLKADYETLSEINPRLIYASISGFGQTGPWALRPGFDLIAQAMSGIMSATGTADGEPVKATTPIADLGSGLFLVYGILSALHGRETSGRGQYIDTSLFEAALGLSIWETTELWASGEAPRPIGTANRMSAPYQAVRSSDGHFVFGAANARLWTRLCDMLGREDLKNDPRFADNTGRMQNREALIAALEEVFVTKTTDEWVDALLEAGIPAGPINDYGAATTADHALARKMVMDVPHKVEGTYKSLGFAVKMSETPQQVRRGAPLLGEHTEEVIGALGLDRSYDSLKEAGAFGR
ncbi:CoA transferase [Acuticoccus sp. M5D2P5]|uniref:CaiB/BaiF CoA transferase family protein n=1 Tax=Acuticoccus kalidii TaxID=2910977 RepID=UPI001F3EC106|nr:CoA transferase [Acuticoccus kalidii]MCF3934676.1 CoA transferase [Acuticoccus kalidii]